jgi:hypothetical protein
MRGEVVYLYAFDVANEIVTGGLKELMGHKVVPFRLPPDRTLPRDVPLHQPLSLELPAWHGPGGAAVQVHVRVYEVGVINIALHVGFEVASWHELMPFHQPHLTSGHLFDDQARALCQQICDGLKDRLRQAAPVSEPEAYTVFCVTALERPTDLTQLGQEERRAIAGLLTETPPERLAAAQVEEVWRMQRSFETSDLVVIDWDAALVVNLSGTVVEELFVLELANLQLEEFRIMDERLDQYLDRAYVDLEKREWWFFGRSAKVLHSLRRLRVDVTKLADEVSHITKFFGDWHLARVYLAANERFYLDTWRQSVDQRLRQLDEFYRMAHNDVYDQRMMWMEAAILLLFVIDVVALFFWKH